MKHFLLTRWNLMSPTQTVYNHPEIDDPEAWMRDRVVKFETYCLPTVLNQTDKDFTWLLSFAPETPAEYTEPYQDIPFVKIIREYHVNYLRKLRFAEGELILTSRLDNDDSIRPEYIELVKSHIKPGHVLDFGGYQYKADKDEWYYSPYGNPHSPFISLLEEKTDQPLSTVFKREHSFMFTEFPHIFLPEKRMYCQVIHGVNLRCRIRGARVMDDFSEYFWG